MVKKAKKKRTSHFLSIDDVLELVPVGRRSLLRMVHDGLFPKPYFLTPNRRAWKESEILKWERALPAYHRYFKPEGKDASPRQPRPPKASRKRRRNR